MAFNKSLTLEPIQARIIPMKELSAKEIAAWHRAQAEKHYELYSMHKTVADSLTSPAAEYARSLREGAPLIPSEEMVPNITVSQLNAELHKKQGRVVHVAQRLKTFPIIIRNLLKDPTCEFAVGPRGFIYPKNAMPEK